MNWRELFFSIATLAMIAYDSYVYAHSPAQQLLAELMKRPQLQRNLHDLQLKKRQGRTL